MTRSRRDFVVTSLDGVAGLYGGATGHAHGQANGMPPEDGYRLWLRYAPPGGAAAAYRQAIGQIVVQGTSATALIIRAEMTAALERMLGAAVPAPGAWGARTRW